MAGNKNTSIGTQANMAIPAAMSNEDDRLGDVVSTICGIVDRFTFIHREAVPRGGTNEHNRLTDHQRVIALKRLVVKKLEASL